MRYQPRIRGFLWLLPAIALAACSGSATPQLIGAYPGDVVTTYSPPPGQTVVTSDAYMRLRVADVEVAGRQAEELVNDHGGYVASTTGWYVSDRLHLTLTLAVPEATYTSLHDALRSLGKYETGQIHTTHSYANDGNLGMHFSTLTLNLAPAERAWRLPRLPSFGWSPLTTFRAAFGVFAGIAIFVIDLAIWLVVIVGPFVLLGLVLRALIRRWRARP